MIHTEVVLQGDGSESLGSGLDLHHFLGLDSLVETVAPAASLHYTAGLLVDDLDLAVDDDVVHVAVEHCVGLEQLVYRMHTLSLERIVRVKLVFLYFLGLGVQPGIVFDLRHFVSQLGHQEELGVAHSLGELFVTVVGELHRALLLVHDEIEVVGDDALLDVLVGESGPDDLRLCFLQDGLDAGFTEILDQRLVFGQTLVGLEKHYLSFVLHLACRDELAGFVEELVHHFTLGFVEPFHIGFVFYVGFVAAALHGT